MLARQPHAPAGLVGYQRTDLGDGQRCAAVEWIDIHLVELELHLHDEVRRQTDAERVQAGGGSEVEEDDRKRERQPHPPFEDFVQIGVAWIVVIRLIATISVDVEHLAVKMAEAKDGRFARRAFLHDAGGQVVEACQILIDVELRIILERNEQRAASEILARDLVLHELAELPARLGRTDEGLQERRLYSMRLVRTEAIVLHTLPARERDKLVVLLTPEHGKVKGFAYGARGIRSRFGASLEPLAKVRIGYAEREAEEAVRIESIELLRSLFPAQQELLRSVAATYLAEMVDTFAPANDPAELIYRLLDRASEALLEEPAGRGPRPLRIVAYVEVWMLRLGGIFPSMRTCIECGADVGRPLRFDVRLMGFVCENCATRDAFVISNDAAAELDAIVRLPVTEFAQRDIAADVLFEIRSLAGTIRRHFLGYELKSFDVLSSVVPS